MSVAAAQQAQAGAWVLEPGEKKLIWTATFDSAERAYDEGGEASADVDFSKTEEALLLEWGVTPRLTLLAQPVVQTVSLRTEAGSEEATGFASSQAGARFRLLGWDGGVASLQSAVVVPGETENISSASLGEGGLAYEARLLAGQSWGGENVGAFVDGQIGYRWREEDEPDEARLDATLGLRTAPRWMFLAQSFSTWGEAAPALRLPETESHKGQLSTVVKVTDRYSVQLGGYATYAGESVVQERALFVAMWRRFGP